MAIVAGGGETGVPADYSRLAALSGRGGEVRGVFRDRTGEKYGRWTVLAQAPHRPDGAACWLCVCDCETQRVVTGRDLYAGRTQSCGCLRKERIAQRYARERGPLKLLKQESRWRRMPSIHVTRAVARPRQHAARDDAIFALAKMGLHREAAAPGCVAEPGRPASECPSSFTGLAGGPGPPSQSRLSGSPSAMPLAAAA